METQVTCEITDQLIRKISGLLDLFKVTTLDLHLRDEAMGKIRKIQHLHGVPNLKVLNLSYNCITMMEGLSKLSALVELNIAENSIRKLENFESLLSLQRLNLSGNQISRIPESITVLRNLQILRCSRNDLSVIQDVTYLGDLKALTSLTMEDNPIMTLEQCIPYTLYCVQSLVTLNNNKITPVAREDAIKRFSVDDMSQMKDLLTSELTNRKNVPMQSTSGKSASVSSSHVVKRIEQKYPIVLPLHATGAYEQQQQLFDLLHGANKDEDSSVFDEEGITYVQTSRFMPQSSSSIESSVRNTSDTRNRNVAPVASTNAPVLSPIHSPAAENKTAFSRHVMEQQNRIEKLSTKLLEAENSKKTLSEENKRIDKLLTSKLNENAKFSTKIVDLEAEITSLKEKSEVMDKENIDHNILKASMNKSRSAYEADSFCSNCEQFKLVIANHEKTLSDIVLEKDNEIMSLRSKLRESDRLHRDTEESNKQLNDELIQLKADYQQQQLFLKYQLTSVNNSIEEESKFLTIDSVDIGLASKETLMSLVLSFKKELASLRYQNQQQAEVIDRERYQNQSKQRTEHTSQSEWQMLQKVELTKCNTQIELLNNTLNRSEIALQSTLKDMQMERERYSMLELNFENSQRKVTILEEKTRNFHNIESDLRRNIHRLEENLEVSQRDLSKEKKTKEKLQSDIENYKAQIVERENDLNVYLAVSNATPAKAVTRLQSRKVNPNVATNASTYLDEHDEEDVAIETNGSVLRSNNAETLPDLQFSRLELVAAQSIAGILLEEIKTHCFPRTSGDIAAKLRHPSPVKHDHFTHLLPPPLKKKIDLQNARHSPTNIEDTNINSPDNLPNTANNKSLKLACSKAALRLLHYFIAKAHVMSSKGNIAGSTGMIPTLEAMFSNKEILASVITDLQVGLTTIDESNAMKFEQNQMGVIIEELTAKELSISKSIAEKNLLLDDISQKCIESKRQGQLIVAELENLATQLHASRNEINLLETEKSNHKREIELKKNDLMELKDNLLREQKAVNSIRERMNELSTEYQQINDQIIKSKEALSSEENKMRQIKLISVEQLHSLQLDVNKLSNDFQEKQRVLEELDRTRKSSEEEAEMRRRELDRQLNYLTKDIEEKTRKISSLKNDSRNVHLECETLIAQKKQLEVEIQHHNESLHNEVNQLHNEQTQYKHLIEHYERLSKDCERKYRANKERNLSLESEQMVKKQAVEELRLQQHELEKINENRKRAHDEELAQVQHQLQAAVRLSKQTITVTEHKRSELDCSITELRQYDRKIEEGKRITKELDMNADHLRESIRNLDIDRERKVKEAASLSAEVDECHKQVQILRIQIEADSRTLEDTKRRCNLIHIDESSMKEAEVKLKHSVNHLKKQLNDLQDESDACRNQLERERKDLLELQSKRNLLEIDIEKSEDMNKNSKEIVLDEERRRMNSIADIHKLRDEISKTQKELVAAQRKVMDEERKQEAIKIKAEQLHLLHDKYNEECEQIINMKKNEKLNLESLKMEFYERQNELKVVKDDLKQSQSDLHRNELNIETSQMQLRHLETVRDTLSLEVQRLRQNIDHEINKNERLEQQYTEIEIKLKNLRIDLSKTEVSYERVKDLSYTEEKRLNDYRKHLQETVQQLYDMECTMGNINKDMFEEKKKASAELMQLGSEKDQIQSHLFRVHEAQKRLSKEGLTVPSTTMNPSSSLIVNVPVLLGGRPVISPLPMYVPSQNTPFPTSAPTLSKARSFGGPAPPPSNLPDSSIDKLQYEINKLKLQSSSILSGSV